MKTYFNENLKDNIENSVSKVGRMRIFHFSLKPKTVIILFGALIVVLGGLSIAAVLNDDENILSTAASTDTSEVESTYTAQVEDISDEVLLMLTDDEQDDIHLLIIFTIDTQSNHLSFNFLQADEIVSLESETMSLQSYYSTYGMTQLISAIKETTGDEIERYVTITEAGVAGLVDLVGENKVSVIDDISYNYNGINYIFSEGEQTLTSDMLTKYVLYLSELEQEAESELVEIVSIYTDAFFEKYTVEDGYDAIVKLVSTNISAYDIMEQKTALEAFFYGENELQITIETIND